VSDTRMTVTGYGEAHPKAPNDTPAHRAENRRVELAIQ
jgi:outer membrane protein OmpA-like peptidoglycan-associated protein